MSLPTRVAVCQKPGKAADEEVARWTEDCRADKV